MSAINVANTKLLGDGSYEIVIFTKLKSTKPGDSTVLVLPKFSDNELCVVSTLTHYLTVTEDLRQDEKLFVCTRPPHRAATRDTLSRWLKTVLFKAGIDVNIYSAHSFRHSSTSKANDRGACIDSIFKAAGWCNNSKIFAKHYRRPIIDRHEFANAVMNM